MREPAEIVEDLERESELPPGSEERCSDYAVGRFVMFFDRSDSDELWFGVAGSQWFGLAIALLSFTVFSETFRTG